MSERVAANVWQNTEAHCELLLSALVSHSEAHSDALAWARAWTQLTQMHEVQKTRQNAFDRQLHVPGPAEQQAIHCLHPSM